MFTLLRFLINKYPQASQRALEILPGLMSWSFILFPVWGSIFWPIGVAYFIIAFNIYWLYQSVQIAITAMISHVRIQASMNYDWVGDLKVFPDSGKIKNPP